MGDVLTFVPRPAPATSKAPDTPAAMSPADRRTRLEVVLQSALDTADHIIAILDAWDGDADLEPGDDAELSLAAPENHHGSQVVWLRGGDTDGETGTPEPALPEVRRSPAPQVRGARAPAAGPLRWNGDGNVLAAAGVALFALVAGEA